jgi:hypothetical protein
MPCPYFAPHLPTSQPESAGGRFPLIDSFVGDCHATATPSPAPPEMLVRYCNQGYSRTDCTHFPAADTRSAMRYSVVRRSDEFLDILIIVECGYAPVTWQPVRYFIDSGVLEPACADACTRAQALAFSKAYLRRFPTDRP